MPNANILVVEDENIIAIDIIIVMMHVEPHFAG